MSLKILLRNIRVLWRCDVVSLLKAMNDSHLGLSKEFTGACNKQATTIVTLDDVKQCVAKHKTIIACIVQDIGELKNANAKADESARDASRRADTPITITVNVDGVPVSERKI